MADRLGARKIKNILATGAQAVISGNAGCTLQLISTLRQNGTPLPVYHPMELLDMSYQS
jgi:glycolate oxidase iron-sulfur subunit